MYFEVELFEEFKKLKKSFSTDQSEEREVRVIEKVPASDLNEADNKRERETPERKPIEKQDKNIPDFVLNLPDSENKMYGVGVWESC